MPVIITVVILALLVFGYCLAVRGRTGHPKLDTIKGYSYAHRGLFSEGVPENSMAAFLAAKKAGYGVELDVHLLADGNLAVIHDSVLERTTGREGRIEDLKCEDLKECFLEGTDETIPDFREVLELFDGQVPIILELKPYKDNYPQLTEAACKLMDGYKGVYCLESFDPRCLLWLKKHRPDIIRGQLSENYFASKTSPLPWILKLLLSENLGNFLTRPDFLAFRYADRFSTLSTLIARKHLACVSWTVKSQEEFDRAVAEGWTPIFEGFRPNPERRNFN